MSLPVTVCGLGRMGTVFAANLAADGHEVTVWNRSPRDLTGSPFRTAADPAGAAASAAVTVLMVFDGAAAQRVLLGQDGVTAGARPGSLVVNATTLAPDEARHLEQEVRAAGLRYLEAPVLGSVPAARDRSLRVLTGGSPEDATEAAPVLDGWSTALTRRHIGPVGTATGMKLVSNLALGVAYAALHDAVSLGADLGLGRDDVLDILGSGPLGAVVRSKQPRLAADHYAEADFTLSGMAKDLALATGTARAAGHPLTVVEAADRLTSRRAEEGEHDLDVSVLGRTPGHARHPR